jgi:4-amino-4-deoxy-L-arabinose transferase-like glycosyltransferase
MSDAPPGASGGRDRRFTLALVAITLLAAVLRFVRLRYVPDNEYYDAAVRSMTLSLHNFLYGAFEPGASAAIDKPPLDLWLQVVSVKLLGFGSTTLKLPQALCGTAAVPLLYDLVRRVAGRLPALASATVLAFLPLSVVAARSDTMDSVMMALLIATAWLLLAGVQRGQQRWLIAAAVLLGLDFNVKLFEALVPVPAFLAFLWLCWRGASLRVRLARLAAAGATFAAVACAWLVFVSLTPAHERPYALGSTNGSVWNAVFVYNGLDRITHAAQPSSLSTTVVAKAAAVSTTAVARAAAISSTTTTPTPRPDPPPSPTAPGLTPVATASPPGPIRLFEHNAIDYGGLIGTALFTALLLGALALVPALRTRLHLGRDPTRQAVIERAAILAAAIWLITGYALFSFASRVHPRYLEAFTPSIAIVLGVSFVVLARRARDPAQRYLLALALLVCIVESAAGTGTITRAGVYAVALFAVAVCVGAVSVISRSARHGARLPSWFTPSVVASALLAALLVVVLLDDDVRSIVDNSTVQAAEVTLSPTLVDPLSSYLLSHEDGARYEVAVSAPELAAPLIIRGLRPVLLLTSINSKPLVTLSELRAATARGEVRYVFIHGSCPAAQDTNLPACSRAAIWVRAHARDITPVLGLHTKRGLLYQLS